MDDQTLRYCATDKEVFDILMSSKLRLTESVMLELGRDRGIFYSPKDSREKIALSIAILPHGHHDLILLLERRDHPGRSEKITSVVLDETISIDEVKEIVKDYQESSHSDEKIFSHSEGNEKYVMQVHYSDIDYSKTRLSQRRPREADIEFIVQGDKTVIRLPASDKAKNIVSKLKTRLEEKMKKEIKSDLIELSGFSSPDTRTEFFTSLIAGLENFNLSDVTSIKVESKLQHGYNDTEDEDELDDDQDKEKAKQEMLAVVKNVAFKGGQLLSSQEYKQLKSKGFFITSIIWRSQNNLSPYEKIECEASFDEPEIGKGFKYNIRGVFHFTNGSHNKRHKPPQKDEKQIYLSLIEKSASKTISDLKLKELRQDNDYIGD